MKTKRFIWLATGLAFCACSTTSPFPSSAQAFQVSEDSKSKMDNLFLKPSNLPLEAPDFAKIKNDQFMPAFVAGMAEQKKQMQAIADSTAEPTFENTLVAMEPSWRF
ncbi:MAG: hypothetical protein U0930_14385 [Pirellulales bacterium]